MDEFIYRVPTVKHEKKYNFAEFRTNQTAMTFSLFKDKSYSNKIIFPFQSEIIPKQNNFSFPMTNHTAIKTFFISRNKSFRNENVFPFQREIMQQQNNFSFSKQNHTATKMLFISKDKSCSNETFFRLQREIIK